MSDSKYLTERELSLECKVSVPWLRKARRSGGGPRYLKINRMVRYCRADVEAWLNTRRVGPR